MSWFRTQLLMFWVGIIFLKLGVYHSVNALFIMGIVILSVSFAGIWYSQKRFSVRFYDQMAVGSTEIIAKKILSMVVLMTAITYGLHTTGALQHWL